MNADIDTTADEIGTDLEPVAAHAPSLFGTDDPAEVIQRASVAASALADVIDKRKLYTSVQGKKHVHVEGWTLMGAMLGVTAVCVETVPVDGGFKATVEARTADGRVVGRADALCTKHEKRGPWKNADDYARLSMAQTRATSKALKGPLGFVVSLAGYATTPADEIGPAEPAVVAVTITAERAASIGLTITEALQEKVIDGPGLSLLFTDAGATPDAINAAAVAALTTDQAPIIEKALYDLLSPIRDREDVAA